MKTKEKRKSSELRSILQSLSGRPLRILFLIGADFLWSVAVQLLVISAYRMMQPAQPGPVLQIWFIPLVMVIINSFAKCYHGNLLNPGAAINRVEEIRRLAYSVFGAHALCVLYFYSVGKTDASPVLPWISFVLTIGGLPVVRFIVRVLMKKMRVGQIRVFIAGCGRTAQQVSQELSVSVYYGYKIVGYFDDDASKREMEFCGEKWLGRICDAPRLAAVHNVHYIICCLPPLALPKIMRSYTHAFEHVMIIPSNDILPITAIYPTLIGFVSGFEFQNRIKFLFPRILKRLLELVIALLSVIFLLPVFALLAVLVKLSSPGPVFYSANRLGQNGRKIKVFKFRTMYKDAESRLETLLEENPFMMMEWQRKFKLEHDPRVTKIGRFLRKTSLDELPQFINVLRGEMAIIGPRPIVQDEVKFYGMNYDFFRRVRPGITGLWQVSGRSSVDYERRVSLDMFYVMNWSIWLDFYILLKTCYVVLLCRDSC